MHKKLKTIPVDLSKLNNVVNDKCVRKTVYEKLVEKVNNIDASGFALGTINKSDKLDLGNKNKNPNVSGLVKKEIVSLKLLKQKVKYLVLLVQLLLLQ